MVSYPEVVSIVHIEGVTPEELGGGVLQDDLSGVPLLVSGAVEKGYRVMRVIRGGLLEA